ncbi:hypothetical protein YA40_16180 [Klebsiella aerogenes]|nr:hypothetical protein YA40_16180 [Klebsiella aerogenes]
MMQRSLPAFRPFPPREYAVFIFQAEILKGKITMTSRLIKILSELRFFIGNKTQKILHEYIYPR